MIIQIHGRAEIISDRELSLFCAQAKEERERGMKLRSD